MSEHDVDIVGILQRFTSFREGRPVSADDVNTTLANMKKAELLGRKRFQSPLFDCDIDIVNMVMPVLRKMSNSLTDQWLRLDWLTEELAKDGVDAMAAINASCAAGMILKMNALVVLHARGREMLILDNADVVFRVMPVLKKMISISTSTVEWIPFQELVKAMSTLGTKDFVLESIDYAIGVGAVERRTDKGSDACRMNVVGRAMLAMEKAKAKAEASKPGPSVPSDPAIDGVMPVLEAMKSTSRNEWIPVSSLVEKLVRAGTVTMGDASRVIDAAYDAGVLLASDNRRGCKVSGAGWALLASRACETKIPLFHNQEVVYSPEVVKGVMPVLETMKRTLPMEWVNSEMIVTALMNTGMKSNYAYAAIDTAVRAGVINMNKDHKYAVSSEGWMLLAKEGVRI